MLNVVFAAPEGERLDTPERKAAIEAAVDEARTKFAAPAGQAEPENGQAGAGQTSRTRSSPTRFSQDGRIAYAEAQFDQTIEDTDRDGVVAVEDFFRQAGEPVGVHGRVQRRGGVPADRAGRRPSCSACWRRSSCC